MLEVLALAAVVALLPFGALVRVALARRARIVQRWQRGEERAASVVVRVRAALDPSARHTIWIGDPRRRGRTILPPLRDEDGRNVVLEGEPEVQYHGGADERVVTRSLPRDELGGAIEVVEEEAQIAGDATLYVRARVVSRADTLVLAPAGGWVHVWSAPPPEVPNAVPDETQPRPVVPLRVPLLALVALSTTMPFMLLARALEHPGLSMPCAIAVLGVTLRAHEVVTWVEQKLDPKAALD